MQRSRLAAVALASVALATTATPLALAARLPTAGSTAAAQQQCAKFSGTVLLTYSSPQTVILHVVKGKVSAATTFTMTPTTTVTRNGVPASFGDVKIGDTGTITAREQLPSGALLACTVSVTGP